MYGSIWKMTNTKCNTSVFKILFKYPYFREYLNTISKYRSRYLNIIKNTWIFEYLTTLSVQYECQTRTKRAIIALQNSTTYTNAQNFFFVGGFTDISATSHQDRRQCSNPGRGKWSRQSTHCTRGDNGSVERRVESFVQYTNDTATHLPSSRESRVHHHIRLYGLSLHSKEAE